MCDDNIIVKKPLTQLTLSLNKTDPVKIEAKIFNINGKPLIKGKVNVYEDISGLVGDVKGALYAIAYKKLKANDEGLIQYYGHRHGKYRLTYRAPYSYTSRHNKNIIVKNNEPVSVIWRLKQPPLISASIYLKTNTGLRKFKVLNDIFCETYTNDGEVVDRWMHGLGGNEKCQIVVNKEEFHFTKGNMLATRIVFKLPYELRGKYSIIKNKSVQLTTSNDQGVRVIVERK